MGCPKGEYYCNDEQKCKSIPAGHKVLDNGELVKEDLKKAFQSAGDTFKNEVTSGKSFKNFKKSAEKFGETGKIDIKKFANKSKGLPDLIKSAGVKALRSGLQSGLDSLKTEELDGSKLAIGATAGIFGAGLELARRGKKFADQIKNRMDKRTKIKEETQGGINIETYTDGTQFNEIETINIIEPPKIKSPSYMTFIEDIKEETK